MHQITVKLKCLAQHCDPQTNTIRFNVLLSSFYDEKKNKQQRTKVKRIKERFNQTVTLYEMNGLPYKAFTIQQLFIRDISNVIELKYVCLVFNWNQMNVVFELFRCPFKANGIKFNCCLFKFMILVDKYYSTF